MAGVVTNVETIRPSKLRTRSLRADEMADLNELCGSFLSMYGLKLGSVVKESLIPVASHPRSKVGILQRELRYAITLLHAVGSAAVCASGLGLGKSDVTKRMVDRSAAGVHGVGLHEILKASGNVVGVIAAAACRVSVRRDASRSRNSRSASCSCSSLSSMLAPHRQQSATISQSRIDIGAEQSGQRHAKTSPSSQISPLPAGDAPDPEAPSGTGPGVKSKLES